MRKLSENTSRGVISHLARRSVSSSRRRNVFTVITIALSVSFLMVLGLFVLGVQTERIRQVSDMQHVLYMSLSREQAEQIAEEADVSYEMLLKNGSGIEVGSSILQPCYYEYELLKGQDEDMEITRIKEGAYPHQYGEVAVTEEGCRKMGYPVEIGATIQITGITGETENFVITGFLDGEWGNARVYPAAFSRDYAEQGPMLANVPYSAAVQLSGARSMSAEEFRNRVVEIGESHGIARRDINPNNAFEDTLSGNPGSLQNVLIMTGVGAGVLFVSVLVIYSVFYLSVIGRVRQFGQLRTLGMTRRQTEKMVAREGLILCGIGIPLGLAAGLVIGYAVRPGGWSWRNSLLLAGAVILLDLISVRISIRRPAKMASQVSPVEAAGYSGGSAEAANGKRRKKSRRGERSTGGTRKLKRNLSPGGLARISAGRNRRKQALTILSLGIGGILFMLAATYTVSVNEEEYSRTGEFVYGEFDIYLSSNAAEAAEHGYVSLQMENPLNEEFRRELLAVDGVKEVHAFQRREIKWEARNEAVDDFACMFDEEMFQEIQENYADKDSPLQDMTYEDLVKNRQIIVVEGGMKEVFGWELEPGETVQITWDTGTKLQTGEYTVAGLIDSGYYDENPLALWVNMPRELVQEMSGDLNLNDSFVVETEAEKTDQAGEEIRALVEERPSLSMDTLAEAMSRNERMFAVVYGGILGISLFIMGFSFLNLTNTLITNIVTRKQEFAMLESVGMEKKQLFRMVTLEGLLLSVGNAVITLAGGSLAGYAGVLVMRHFDADYMHYHFPGWFFLGYVVVLVILPLVVGRVVLHSFSRQGLTERLRIVD